MSAETNLSFADAQRIAKGCLDYGGGYRSDPALFEAYHAGMHTVMAALEAASKRGVASIAAIAKATGAAQ